MKDSDSFSPSPTSPPQPPSRASSPIPSQPTQASTSAPPSPSATPPPPPPPQNMTIAQGRHQSSLKHRPSLPVSPSAPSGQLPLLSGDSYISPIPSAFVGQTTSLAELAHLVKLQSYQEHKHLQSRIRLHKSLVSSAVSARLTRSGGLCHKALVDYFKSDQKSDFAALYNALHDVRNSCEATRRFAMLEPELDSAKPTNSSDDNEGPKGLTSFLHEIPVQARDTILSFISMIRSSPTFLANRLVRLTNSELESLVRHHYQPNPQESILPQQAPRRGNAAVSRNTASQIPVPSPVERLLAFHRNDPLYTILHTIFANSTGPDSAEDKRRTDVWATTCAKLICENKGESFLLVVMDSWAAMREWPAKANLEICLMNLIQEGSFLVDENNGGSQADLRGKQDLLAEEFWIKAEKKLLEVLDDDPSAGGIPEGILELGHAILQKINDPKKQRQAEIILVAKWFFQRFLTNGIAYPEYYGIMTGHHISEHARLKILRPVLKKMYNHAVSVVFGDWKTNNPVEPVVRGHIENLLARFRNPHPIDSTPVLLPTKAITSPRETTEVQPFVVLCPADIVTLYRALYPQGSSAMVEGRDIRGTMGSRSSSRQIFGKSPNTGFEIGSGSVLSGSGSSVTSESASMTYPLLERSSFPDDRRSFTSIPLASPSSFSFNTQTFHPSSSDPNSLEKFGLEVRSAVEAMMGRLGPDVTSGKCHPCAEKWAVIYVSPDGKELSLKMRKDWGEDDDDDDDEGHNSDSEDEAPLEVSGLDRVYNQLKESVMKLVAEFEIPEETVSENTKFSNRPSAAKANSTPSVSTIPIVETVPETKLDPSNPFHPQSNLTAMITAGQSKAPAPDRSRGAALKDNLDKPKQRLQAPPSLLFTMLQAASTQCLARGDYVSSQQYHRALLQARKLPSSLQRDEHAPLLHIFSRDPRDSIERSAAGIEECEAWFVWLTLAQERHEGAVDEMMRKVKDLRDKMWYVTDVRNSAAYDEARNVALALKKMGMPQRPKTDTKTKSSSRNLSHRMSTSSFSLLKSDTLIDILAAQPEHGGLNKLSDEQATMTFEYLSRYSVENFCKGEERIHRFCLEIDKCVTKLVGDGILDGPVLWSSELFSRDDREMAINRQKGELYLAGVGTLSVSGDDDDHEDGRVKRSLDMLRRPSTSDIFGRNRSTSIVSSIHDLPSSRGKGRTKSNAGLMDSIDRQDLFGLPSPALQSETHNTYWSPFSSHSNNSSSGRPKTAHSPTSLSKSLETVNHQKRKFLGELKQSLTGLLLSDLGLEVFSQGSETDGWFSGGLGDECIQRKEEQEEAKRKAAEKQSSKNSGGSGNKKLARKKSTKNVRKSANTGTFEALGKEKKGELAAPVATLENVGREAHSGEENSSSSDATARTSTLSAAKKGGLMAFPYGHAFRRLLMKFSTHPNPFHKLQAIYELELLIVASLSSRSPSCMRKPTLPSMPSSPFLGAMGEASSRICSLQLSQPSNIEEAMANLEERRSNVMNSGAITSPLMTPSGARSPTHTAAPSADMIVDVLQHLFRQAEIRPKTLFRDLQFVAAFVPASILDRTAIGKAFWDTGLAALGLKQDVCRTMAEIADEIVAKDTTQRESESGKEKGNKGENKEYSRYTMQDAATMWNIAAKEGDPAAQRELAIFYLTNPTLLPRSTKPLSKPKDTFRPEMMVAKGEDPEKRDPATMCVAYHWMELSAQGGDELARKYLRSQREEW